MELIVDFILITGIVLSIIIILKLFKTKNNQLPKKILVVFWLFILLNVIFIYGQLHKLDIICTLTYIFVEPSVFLLAVLMYIYVKSIFYSGKNILKKHYIHFLPFVIYLLFITIPSYINYVIDKNAFPYIWKIFEYTNLKVIQSIYSIIYLLLSLKVYYKYKPRLKQFLSTYKEKDFVWIYKFIILFLIVMGINMLIHISRIYLGYYFEWSYYITILFVILAIAYLGYFGLTQTTMILTDISSIQTTPPKNTPRLNIIKPTEEVELKTEFNRLFNEEKIHLKPDLNLIELSQKMQITSRKLSSFLNDVLNTNFYDCVNNYRIEEAKNMLVTDKVNQYTITAIGEMCGYNSKSSFFRLFKNRTGYSPSKYMDIHRKNKSQCTC